MGNTVVSSYWNRFILYVPSMNMFVKLRRTTIGSYDVANDPAAEAMYYLNCMCSMLRLDHDPDIKKATTL